MIDIVCWSNVVYTEEDNIGRADLTTSCDKIVVNTKIGIPLTCTIVPGGHHIEIDKNNNLISICNSNGVVITYIGLSSDVTYSIEFRDDSYNKDKLLIMSLYIMEEQVDKYE